MSIKKITRNNKNFYIEEEHYNHLDDYDRFKDNESMGDLKLTQCAVVVIDSRGQIIKCRWPIEDILNGFFEYNKRKIQSVEQKVTDTNWELNPDKSGGAFTEQEIQDSTRWK